MGAPKLMVYGCEFPDGNYPTRPEDIIVWQVCNHYGVTIKDIKGRWGKSCLWEPRKEIIKRLYTELKYPISSIANLMNRNYKTIMLQLEDLKPNNKKQRLEKSFSMEDIDSFMKMVESGVRHKIICTKFGLNYKSNNVSRIADRIRELKIKKTYEIQLSEKICMSCPDTFMSEGNHNRMCKNCRYTKNVDPQMASA